MIKNNICKDILRPSEMIKQKNENESDSESLDNNELNDDDNIRQISFRDSKRKGIIKGNCSSNCQIRN